MSDKDAEVLMDENQVAKLRRRMSMSLVVVILRKE
jgi:hypothetical protein